LSEAQVEALLAAPDVASDIGVRDRTMLELMYASGLRVSELVSLKVFQLGLNDNVLRVMGKGSKERLVPYGEVASQWLRNYLGGARAAARYARRHGRRPKNDYGSSLFAVSAADGLRWAASTDALVAAFPRYHPRWAWWLTSLPGVREFLVSNLVVVLQPLQPDD
jgi:site-specific recombinase XerD